MLEVKQVVQAAAQFVQDMYQGEGIVDLRLEEVERLHDKNQWAVTLSFARPPKHPLAQALAGSSMQRDYKILIVDASTGAIESMRIRELESSKAE
ncbi:MAG TPA: hypothetical protein VMV10_28320 [Pirellulales bacterium]|nr:hypothetical protein [Pirellulales bacterium]